MQMWKLGVFPMNKNTYLGNKNLAVEMQFSKLALENEISMVVFYMATLFRIFYPNIFLTITKHGN